MKDKKTFIATIIFVCVTGMLIAVFLPDVNFQ